MTMLNAVKKRDTFEIPVELIDESPTNPRKVWRGIEQLAAEILQEGGLIHPVLVRPRPEGRYELVVGSRRFRATKHAELPTIEAHVEDLSDEAVHRKQLVENHQREDVHPLEESDGYALAKDRFGKSVEQIAAEVGVKPGTVYARLKLAKLCEDGRRMFLDGEIYEQTALALARIVDPKRQADAAYSLSKIPDYQRDDSGAIKSGSAEELIRTKYQRELKNAPFELDDAELVKTAGSCEACPSRLGNLPEYAPDLGRADVCLKPDCYFEKCETLAQIRKKEAKGNLTVMSSAEAAKLFETWDGGGLTYKAREKWLDIKERNTYHGDGKKTYKQILGASCPPVTLAPHAITGQLFELVDHKEALAVLKRLGIKTTYQHTATPAEKKRREDLKAKEAIAKQVNQLVIAQLVEAIEKREGDDLDVWLSLLQAIESNSYSATQIHRVAERRGWDKLLEESTLGDVAITLPPAQVRGLVAELVVNSLVFGYHVDEEHLTLCERFDVDWKGIEGKVRQEYEEKQAAKAKKAEKGKKGDKAPAKKDDAKKPEPKKIEPKKAAKAPAKKPEPKKPEQKKVAKAPAKKPEPAKKIIKGKRR